MTAKPNGIYMPVFSIDEIEGQGYQCLSSTYAALSRQHERFCKGKIDPSKWGMCERANAYMLPISVELRARELDGAR